MHFSSVRAIPFAVLLCVAAQGQNLKTAVSASLASAPAQAALLSPGMVRAERYATPEFVGTYRPDGTFKRARNGRFNPVNPAEVTAWKGSGRPAEVPTWVDLHPVEAVVQDHAPHARKTLVLHSHFSSLFGSIVTAAYGRERVLATPTHITTDSKHRVIVSDPQLAAVHVLDDKNSFRIEGGPGRRLQSPVGVAVDRDDNIYVADKLLRLVLVYDSQGRFLRYIGQFADEAIFENPTAIAIDRKGGRLYVLDSAVNQLLILDLDGNVLRRAGGRRDPGKIHFNNPRQISVGATSLAVLDSGGSRVRVLDLDGDFLTSFDIRDVNAPPLNYEMPLAIDAAGDIYVSTLGWETLKVYRPDGRLVASLNDLGTGNNQCRGLSGMWIDDRDRIFVTDASTGYIQLFQGASTPSEWKKEGAIAAR